MLLSISIIFSCTYPKATLVKKKNSSGNDLLKIKYKTPKLFSYDLIKKENHWVILFQINDYTSIPIPPTGSIIDNRWFYYLAAIDNQFNPLIDSINLIEEHKQTNSNYTGTNYGIFSTNRGVVFVYKIGNVFYFSEFDSYGKTLIHKNKFYKNLEDSVEKSKILSMNYHDDSIYIFLVESPKNIYENYSFNLIQYHIPTKDLKVYKNYIPKENSWYSTNQMEIHFTKKNMQIIWSESIDAKLKNSALAINLAECEYKNLQCTNFRNILNTEKSENTDIRIFRDGGNSKLFIQEEKNLWLIISNEENFPLQTPIKLENNSKEYIEYFQKYKNYPIQVEVDTN